MKFYTCHDNTTVMACAKFRCDPVAEILFCNYQSILGISSINVLVKQVTDNNYCHNDVYTKSDWCNVNDRKIPTTQLNYRGPFTNIATLIPAWISNYIHYKVWDEITYPIPKLQRCWSLGMEK